MMHLPGYICMIILISTSQSDDGIRSFHYNLDDDKLAIKGYDPVSYFINDRPLKGKKSIQYLYGGVMYYFTNQKNLDLFKGNPEKYEPEYGGWCAFAMGESGDKVKIDPETYKIIDHKLYLFYNFFFNNTLEDWNENEKQLKMKADLNWKMLTKE